MAKPLIRLERACVALGGKTILRDLDWRLRAGEHWAILGGNGSGKSTFLKLVRGELAPAPGGSGRRYYAFDGDEQVTAVGVREKIALVSPEAQGRYLQQEWTLTAREVVHSGFGGGDYVYERPSPVQLAQARRAIRLAGVEDLLGRNVQELSTGELRKVLVARALAGSPRVLICDEICDGLDAPARTCLLEALARAARAGTQLLVATHRREEILPCLTHQLVLRDGRILSSSRIAGPRTTAGPGGKPRPTHTRVAPIVRPEITHARSAGRTLIRMEGASVFLGGKPVLRNITMEIRAGEHWAVLGDNGSGKSTLLKLMAGDLHPALGGRVRRFDFTPENTLWELRRRIGLVSPELQSAYREPLSGLEVIASGFFSSIGLMQRPTRGQLHAARELAARLGLEPLARKNALEMSYGEFRRILLARALVQHPELLICDEPFDGLDAPARFRLARSLEQAADGGATLVMVTHHAEDLPSCLTHVARLERGRLVFQGTIDSFQRWAAR